MTTPASRGRERLRNTPETFWAKVDKSAGPDACWPWTGARTAKGYGVVNYGGRQVRAHRQAWILTNGPTEAHVLHGCDNPPCCNPGHLRPGTPYDNAQDRTVRGRHNAPTGDRHPSRLYPEARPRGERQGQAKLTESDVLAIRASTETQHVLAKRYGVSQSNICQIRRGQTWTHKLAEPSK